MKQDKALKQILKSEDYKISAGFETRLLEKIALENARINKRKHNLIIFVLIAVASAMIAGTAFILINYLSFDVTTSFSRVTITPRQTEIFSYSAGLGLIILILLVGFRMRIMISDPGSGIRKVLIMRRLHLVQLI